MDNGKRFLPRIKEFFEKTEKPKTPVAPVEANGGTLESTEVKTVINDLTYIFEQIGPQAYLPENITLLIKQLFVTDSLSTLINFYQRIYKPKELEHKSARSFWPRYIEEEYAKGTKKEIPLHESVAGGAGVWGYQIDIEPTLVTDIDSNITKALSTVYNRNQTALRKLFETEQKKGNLPKSITFEDRLSPAYLDNWLNIVGKRRDPETKKALKEFDVKIGIGNERVRKPNSQFIGIRKNKKDLQNDNDYFVIETVSRAELDKRREFNRLAENGHIAKVMLINEGTNIVGIEFWGNHYNLNEESGRAFFEEILNIPAIVPKVRKPETQILREVELENFNEVLLDVESSLILSKKEDEIIKSALKKFSNPPMTFSTFLGLGNLLLDDNELSSYICVEPSKEKLTPHLEHQPSELQLALLSRPKDFKLETMLNSIENLNTYFINKATLPQGIYSGFSKLYEAISSANKFTYKDIQRAKQSGASIISILGTYVPETLKTILSNIFDRSNRTITQGSSQESVIGEGSDKFKYAHFITALSSFTNRSVSSKKTIEGREIASRYRVRLSKENIQDKDISVQFDANNRNIKYRSVLMYLATTILIADSQRKDTVEKYLDDLAIVSKIIDPEIAKD